jgi:transcriptional regulator GlxA family with amidase domain
MTETTDQWLALDDLPGSWLDGVYESIRAATTDRERIDAIERSLLKRTARASASTDATVIACIDTLRGAGRTIRLDELGARFGLSSRQLERRFNDAVGMGPRLLASILRFRAVFDALSASPRAPWLAAAIDAGYFDQAHMIRDFRRFAGAAPQSFYRSISGLSAALVDKTGTDHDSPETGDRP